MNKKHQQIFDRIKQLLSKQFGEELNEYEDGMHLTIGESGIWISADEMELTVGYGMNHRHYNPEYDNINDAVQEFFNLLTKKKRITAYYKGKFLYKTKAEIETDNGEFSELSTSLTWFFPFWKKTNEKVQIEKNIIDQELIEKEMTEIKNYAQHYV